MALIATILEAAVRDREDWEAEDALLSTSEGLAVDLAATHCMTPEGFPTCRAAWEPLDGAPSSARSLHRGIEKGMIPYIPDHRE